MGSESIDYCREIEAYLCRKNDGHLIRVVGPSFELVSAWDAEGVPLKIAFQGIDRCFERYYRKGPRRRPVRIDFCDADVRDVFDEWRRAVGVATQSQGSGNRSEPESPASRRPSLAAHLERAVVRLTNARATGTLGAAVDAIIDRVSEELDAARASSSGGLRGNARRAVVARLAVLDQQLLQVGRATMNAAACAEVEREADEELSRFRQGMPEAAYRHAHDAASDRIIRQRLGLPVLAYD